MAAQTYEPTRNEMQAILIISQDAELRNVWGSYFAHESYRLITEVSPLNGIQTSRLLSPALIILDLDLPGDELLRLCRELRSTTNGTLLLLLPQPDTVGITEYYRAGVDECIPNPINPMALLIKSITWLARQDWIVPRRQVSFAST